MTASSDQARATIERVGATIAETATLAERKAEIDAAYPFGERAYWPYKAWLKARRQYLQPFGYGPKKALTPLEKMIAALPRDPETGRPII